MEQQRVEVRELSDEAQAEWIKGMKAWEIENPIDKAGKHPKILGVVSGTAIFLAVVMLKDIDFNSLSPAPLYAVPFAYLIYYLANRRFLKWDSRRRQYSDELIRSLRERPEPDSDSGVS